MLLCFISVKSKHMDNQECMVYSVLSNNYNATFTTLVYTCNFVKYPCWNLLYLNLDSWKVTYYKFTRWKLIYFVYLIKKLVDQSPTSYLKKQSNVQLGILGIEMQSKVHLKSRALSILQNRSNSNFQNRSKCAFPAPLPPCQR